MSTWRAARAKRWMTKAVTRPQLTPEQKRVVESNGRVLVTGGPGSGKTTTALAKAASFLALGEGLDCEVLFVSFSNAAVQRILGSSRSMLAGAELKRLRVSTFHRVALDILRSHGRLVGLPSVVRPLTVAEASVLPKGTARPVAARALERGGGLVRFERMVPLAVEVLRRSSTLRSAYQRRFPLVIIDEFQDTSDDQYDLAVLLAGSGTMVMLGDADQHVYDFAEKVREDRILHTQATCPGVKTFRLGQNHRSPASSVVRYARCVLSGQKLGNVCAEVTVKGYQSKGLGSTLKAELLALERKCQMAGIARPSVAVMAFRNRFVGRLSNDLLKATGKVGVRLYHRVIVSLDEVEPAWQSLLWIVQSAETQDPGLVANALRCAATLARLRGGKGGPTEAEKLEGWARALDEGRLSKRVKGVNAVVGRITGGAGTTGNLPADVRAALAVISDVPGNPFRKVLELLQLRSPDRVGESVRNRLIEHYAVDAHARCRRSHHAG